MWEIRGIFSRSSSDMLIVYSFIHLCFYRTPSPTPLYAQPRDAGLSQAQGAHCLRQGPMNNPHKAEGITVIDSGQSLPPASRFGGSGDFQGPPGLLALQPLSLATPQPWPLLSKQAGIAVYRNSWQRLGTGPWARFQAGRMEPAGVGSLISLLLVPAKLASVSLHFSLSYKIELLCPHHLHQ